MITEAYSGTASITNTEFSCPNNTTYSAGAAITASGVYQVFFDTSDMTVGDQLQLRIYEKCRSVDTQRVIYESILTANMTDNYVMPSLILIHGWDVTLRALSGTITVNWSIRKVA